MEFIDNLFVFNMKNYILLAAVSEAQALWWTKHGHNHIKQEIPSGDEIEQTTAHKRNFLNWGKIELTGDDLEEYTTHETIFDQVSSLLGEYHGLTNKFGSADSSPKDMNQESPLIKDAKKSDMKNKEHHDSPFYTVENDSINSFEDISGGDASKGVPTAMFHGFGDACINPGDLQFNEQIRRSTKAPVHCIEVGLPFVGEVLNNFETVA